MGIDEELLAVKAAELYYEEGKSQQEIGELLKLTRWKVGRLLALAKERGFIRIEIVHPRARRLPLERQLRETFGLNDAVVVPDSDLDDADDLHVRVIIAAAEYLTALRPIPRVLGISWGRTLHDVAGQLSEGWANGVNVVQLNGGVSLNRRASSAATTAVTIASKASGSTTLLPSPAILEHAATREAIESDRTVASVLEAGRNASAFLYSAGVPDSSSVLVQSGYLTKEDVAELVRKGAVGDVLGRYIDADGNIVDPGLNYRTLGLELDELRKATVAIAVVAGPAKNDICRAVVTSGLCTVLVTNESCANYLLETKR
jgi:deoxyribonucleoside regulator